MNTFRDSEIPNTAVRMVVPMRREFGRHFDVSQFLRDQGYAQAVLDEAMCSGDSRLRDHATYVQARLSGARMAADPPAPGGAARRHSGRASARGPQAGLDAGGRTARPRAARYTSGLR